MDISSGIFVKTTLDVDTILESGRLNEWKIFQIDFSKINDRKSLFRCITENLPLDPMIKSDRSFDALSDSLWSGLYEVKSGKILILIQGYSNLQTVLPNEFAVFKDILYEIVSTMKMPEYTGKGKKNVCVFLVEEI